MRYRQWKKNYKKRYGVNPPASIDKRKRRRQAARAVNVLANTDLGATLNRAAESIVNGIANAMRVFVAPATEQEQFLEMLRIDCSHWRYGAACLAGKYGNTERTATQCMKRTL